MPHFSLIVDLKHWTWLLAHPEHGHYNLNFIKRSVVIPFLFCCLNTRIMPSVLHLSLQTWNTCSLTLLEQSLRTPGISSAWPLSSTVISWLDKGDWLEENDTEQNRGGLNACNKGVRERHHYDWGSSGILGSTRNARSSFMFLSAQSFTFISFPKDRVHPGLVIGSIWQQ